MTLSWVVKVLVFCLAGILVGVILALMVWFLGKNPIQKVNGVSLYFVKAPFSIIISNKKFDVDSDLYLYQKDENEGSSKYFVIVRQEKEY